MQGRHAEPAGPERHRRLDITVSAGSHLTLPAVTTDNGFTSETIEATGAGSMLTLPALSSITGEGNGCCSYAQFEALAGGDVELPALTQISGPAILLESNGSGSVLDAPALTQSSGEGGQAQGFQASDGGSLLVPVLASCLSETITVQAASLSLPDLSDADGTAIKVSGGGELALAEPSPSTVVGGNLSVTGSGSSVDVAGNILNAPPTSGADATINVPLLPLGMTLDLNSGGTFSGNTTFNVGSGTTVDLLSGTYTGEVTFNVGQDGTVDLTGGQTVTYSGTLTGSGSGTVEIASGALAIGVGGVALDFPGTLFQWTGGGISGAAGNLTNLGTINLAGSNDKDFFNDGTL